jgi:hypothetical protein
MNAAVVLRVFTWVAIAVVVAEPIKSNAGSEIIPSDVAFIMSAEPANGIEPGDFVTLTLSATNLGPEPVTTVILLSSHFVEELDFVATTCEDFGSFVTDLGDGYYYTFTWYPARAVTGSTLAVGQTRTCTLTFAMTAHAPDVYPFRFYIPDYFQDINPANDSATVYLRRVPTAPPTPVTANGRIAALLLGGLLLFAGVVAVAATRGRYARSTHR